MMPSWQAELAAAGRCATTNRRWQRRSAIKAIETKCRVFVDYLAARRRTSRSFEANPSE
jgi:hypothetical protein